MLAVASIALAVWLYLLLARGAFWRCSERDDWGPAELPGWPRVAAVVPARNEADCIGDSIGSLLAQDYGGEWTVILVDAIAAMAPPKLRVGLRTPTGDCAW